MAQKWPLNSDEKLQTEFNAALDSSHTCPTSSYHAVREEVNFPEHPRLSPRMVFSALAAVAFTSLFLHCAAGSRTNPRAEPLEQSWAQYSPFFPVGQYEQPPKGCEITQVNLIQRHGARFPTAGAALGIVSGVSKLQSVEVTFRDPKLQFLKTYEYDLGTDDLVPSGAQQSFDSGQEVFKRYTHLISEENLPFVRASHSNRVIQSATNWTAGFSKASNNYFNPKLSVTISEDKGANNTLDDNNCPAQVGSDAQTSKWISVFAPPITQRLNKAAPGANLTDQEIYSLMSLCAFDTVAHLSDGKYPNNRSPFCDLFTKKEFEFFEYTGDLDKYYNTGYGNALGPVQGVGYVNELIARLTSEPVEDSTQTNHTLDDSPVTFPFNRTVYADFSHDNQIIPIYATIGLFKQTEALNPHKFDPSKTWIASHLVPFAGRMVVEKLECSSHGRDSKEEYVRIFVNDALQPLEFCSESRGHGTGLCTLDAFIRSQTYARNNGEGDFERCFQ